MSRVTNANPYTKEKIIAFVLIALVIGFIVGTIFMLTVNNDAKNAEDFYYHCKENDIFYIKDRVCGNELGTNIYEPIKVTFNTNSIGGLSVTNLKLLLANEDVPKYMKEVDHFYLETSTEFATESSLERQEKYNSELFLGNK